MTRLIVGIAALGFAAICTTASLAGAEIYRWVDESGQTHLVSDLSKVPPEHREAAIADSKRTGGTVNIIEGIDDAAATPKAIPPPPPESAPPPMPPEAEEVGDASGDGGYYEDGWRERHRERRRRAATHAAEDGLEPDEAREKVDGELSHERHEGAPPRRPHGPGPGHPGPGR
jgi:hypothetical protein